MDVWTKSQRHPFFLFGRGRGGRWRSPQGQRRLREVGVLGDPPKFSKSLKSVENYIQKIYKTCNDIMKAIQQLKRPALNHPKQPTRANHTDASGSVGKDEFEMAKFAWKEDYKGIKHQKDKYKDNELNAWALIYGQCSPELKN